MFLKLVHDTKGKELNFHDCCLEPGSVSGAGVQRGQDGPLPLRSSQSRWEMQFHSSCHSLSYGLGIQVLRFSRILRKSYVHIYIWSHIKQLFQFFKCWQPIQTFINHCVGQIKHDWGLNLAHRPPVFNLCSRRRTEFQLGWKKFILWNKAARILSPHTHLHSAPANQREKELEPWSWEEKTCEKELCGGQCRWDGIPATWLQSRWGEAWPEADDSVLRASRELWEQCGQLSDCIPRKRKSL